MAGRDASKREREKVQVLQVVQEWGGSSGKGGRVEKGDNNEVETATRALRW